eukprot:TRINITY_DN13484_c0_g1_i2.p1 TRINITY_DN13484_c0_g1~~TRINITY_DN13484_c0_g1_i2.p1  ORF type:complete len:374 (+),score=42.33 TRINITY_DN13484_c0_g1_i2:31-1152(+)
MTHNARAASLVTLFSHFLCFFVGAPSDDSITQQVFYGSLGVSSCSFVASIFTPSSKVAVHVALLFGNTCGVPMSYHWGGPVWTFLMFFIAATCWEAMVLHLHGVSSTARCAHIFHVAAMMWAAYVTGHLDGDLVDEQVVSKSSALTFNVALCLVVATLYLQLRSDSRLRKYLDLLISRFRRQSDVREIQIEPVLIGSVRQSSNKVQNYSDDDFVEVGSSGSELGTVGDGARDDDLAEDDRSQEEVDRDVPESDIENLGAPRHIDYGDVAFQYSSITDAFAALFTLPEHTRAYGAALVSFLQPYERYEVIRSLLMERTKMDLSYHIASFAQQTDSAAATCAEEDVPSTEVHKVRREIHTQDEGFGVVRCCFCLV